MLLLFCLPGSIIMKFQHLILDSTALFSQPPQNVSQNYYTVSEVIDEIRDESTRIKLKSLPFKLEILQPSQEAFALVKKFSQTTGDAAVLSPTDIKVAALAVHLELMHNKQNTKLKTEPDIKRTCITKDSKKKSTSPTTQNEGKEDGEETNDHQDQSHKHDDEWEGEWISPIGYIGNDSSNSSQSSSNNESGDKCGLTKEHEQEQKDNFPIIKVACQTGDYAIQNLLIQMHIEIYSPDGRRIDHVRNWLLRCHACYTCTHNVNAKFCPNCGGPTLLRTSYSIDSSGNLSLFLKSNFRYRKRGNIYSIPTPKPGSCKTGLGGDNLFLREDEPGYQKACKRWEWQQRKIERMEGGSFEDINDRLTEIFGDLEVVGKRGGSSNQRGGVKGTIKDGFLQSWGPPKIGHGRKNPNEVKR